MDNIADKYDKERFDEPHMAGAQVPPESELRAHTLSMRDAIDISEGKRPDNDLNADQKKNRGMGSSGASDARRI